MRVGIETQLKRYALSTKNVLQTYQQNPTFSDSSNQNWK